MTQILHKIDEKQLTTTLTIHPHTIHPITRIIPHQVTDHLVNIVTAIQDMDTTNPTNMRNRLMCL